ncbi:immunoglobulin I-set domain-containing protein [Haloferula helveola]|uniref:Immunoglobulin I-set domain-containing protein n=1 Tax=Haloferula helveola TaxID=490095 RepID=A0ABM7RAV8_9BACT|nr:immunoglobulin I-set domain-containing protein [Haloferula helveola]
MKAAFLLALALGLAPVLTEAVPVIRIMPMGDSITNGSSFDSPDGTGGYRGPLYDLLTTAGYDIDYVGSLTVNSELLVEKEHEGHGGWRIDQLDANAPTWFSTISPDIILLHIGTNDFGQNFDTPNAINRLDDLITKMAGLRPDAHIIVTNLMERGEPQNTDIQSQFNPFVQDVVNDQIAAGNLVSFLDMRSEVPLSDMPDNLHPDQNGYDKMAAAWFDAVDAYLNPGDGVAPELVRVHATPSPGEVVVNFNKQLDPTTAENAANYSLDGGISVISAVLASNERDVILTTDPLAPSTTYTLTVSNVEDVAPVPNTIAPASTAEFVSQIAPGYDNNVEESECYTLVYSLDLPNAANYKIAPVPYSVDTHVSIGTYDRVAYYMELQTPGGELQYAWASMDAFDTDAAHIGVPTLATGVTFQQSVSNLNVVSNVPGVDVGEGLTGNLEFWPTNYQAPNGAGVPGASDAVYDFGDNISPGDFGSMQIHNTSAAETVISFSRWGGAAGNACVGIGNQPSGNPDWTFADNAADYTIKKLQVLVRTTGDLTSPTLVSAEAGFDGESIIVTFSEPIRYDTLLPENFSVDEGVSVLSVSVGDDRRTVILNTTPLPAAALTLTADNLRDTSQNANVIAPGSSIAVTAAALPAEVVASVGAAADGYELVYSLDIPVTGNFNALGSAAYRIDNSDKPGSFSRVAYYMELQSGATTNYVWVSMDPFTQEKDKLGVPTVSTGARFQQLVSNLDIISNKAGLTTGLGLATGNIEFWPNSYNQGNTAGIPGASGATYDFGDNFTTSPGYGSMQVHNHGAGQTVFALNRFGVDGNPLCVGIGNDPSPTNGGVDWTFADNAGTEYTKRTLHVMVLPAALPPEITDSVGAAADGYELVYSLDIPATGNLNSANRYAIDRSAEPGTFSRVAYFLELDDGVTTEYIWTAMDAFTQDKGRIGVPTDASGAIFQQYVDNLDVLSNQPGIVTGTGLGTGNIEFWPGSYNQGNSLGVPGANGGTFDFGDNRTTAVGYGCMQVHNYGAAQTLWALNRFGVDGNPLCLGIGNDPNPGNGTDWTFEDNAGSYIKRTLHVLVLPSDLPAEVTTNVPESAGYELVYTLDIPELGNLAVPGAGFTDYTLNNSFGSAAFSRVAYYMELQKTGDPEPTFVWVSMDPFTQNRGQIGVPTVASGALWQQYVTNMTVISNSPNVTEGSGLQGNLEFWPGNYNANNDVGIPGASSALFDFGDGGAGTGYGHGSMQIHNPGAGETVFALNKWGNNGNTTNELAVGIGTNPALTNNDPDWTFTYNAGDYDLVRRLHVLVLPADGAPEIENAIGSTTLDRFIVSFDRELTDDSADPAHFFIDGGPAITGATLLPGNREIAVTTAAQVAGALYTVEVTGVRDRTGGAEIVPGSTVDFTAYDAPAILANVPDPGMELIYHLDVPVTKPRWNFNAVTYGVDEAKYGEILFDRVAYLFELDGDWVYASFDPHTTAIAETGVPSSQVTSTPFQQIVTNMNVASNVPGIITGNGIATGNIEFWGGNYDEVNALGIPGASGADYDFGDTMTPGGHGSMQVHNHGASQTLFAYNNWGANSGGASEMGIGNNTGDPSRLDWTLTENGASYATRNLYVLVHPGGTATGPAPTILVHPCDRSVAAGEDVTFSVIVEGDGPFNYQWYHNGSPVGTNAAWLELTSVDGGDPGSYSVVVTGANLGSTTSETAVLEVSGANQPPTFSGYTFAVQQGTSAVIPIASILANASDLDGGTPDLISAADPSVENGDVVLGVSDLTYTPPPGFYGSDSFAVTIEDGQGGSVVGAVSVSVTYQPIDPDGSDLISFLPGGMPGAGQVEAVFHLTPGVEYGFQRSLNLVDWFILSTAVAGDDGIVVFTDPAPPAPAAFYQAITPVPSP